MATDSQQRVDVRIFADREWSIYRDLRLRALADSPDAFGGTLGQSQQHSDAHWKSRLENARTDTDLPLLCLLNNVPSGLTWGKIESANREQATLYQMWVSPQARGLGAGKMLLDAVIAWAQIRRVKQILLGVACGNSAATRLYAGAGFIPIGEPEPLRPGSALLAQGMVLTPGTQLPIDPTGPT